MKKKIFICIMASILLAGCGEIPKLKNGEEAIIEFKSGDKISVDALWKDMKDEYALQVLLTKIDTKILEDKYKNKLDEVEDYIKSYETSFRANYASEEEMLQTLSYYGYSSIDGLLNQQRISYLNDLATKDYTKKVITDKQLKDYYDNEVVGDVNCNHILVKPKSDSTDDTLKAEKKAKEIIDAIKKDIKSGTKPVDAFKKYKDNSDVTYEELGFFNKGEMDAAFEEEAYKLKKNEYSTTPVKSSFGYHIVLKIDEKAKPNLEKEKSNIKTKLAEKLAAEDTKLATKAMIELRKDYGVKWHDKDLKSKYDIYMNRLLNQTNEEQ